MILFPDDSSSSSFLLLSVVAYGSTFISSEQWDLSTPTAAAVNDLPIYPLPCHYRVQLPDLQLPEGLLGWLEPTVPKPRRLQVQGIDAHAL